jgi:hypothetical protein
VLDAQRGRRNACIAGRPGQSRTKSPQSQFLEGLGGVDQDEAVLLQAGEDIDLVQQGRVLDDDGIGLP